jgi:invasion protein IalB
MAMSRRDLQLGLGLDRLRAARSASQGKGMMLMMLGAGRNGVKALSFAQRNARLARGLGLAVMLSLMALGTAPGTAHADSTMPPDTVFKSWTMICRMAPQAQGDTTAPVPYCRIYHRVRVQDDANKALLIATARYQGSDKTPMLVLTLPAIANLQRGVTFQVDQSQIYKANIQVCTAQSCVSEFKLTDDLMKLFRGGSQASFSFGINPQGEVKRDVPLAGFGAAMDALLKTGH